VKHTSLVSRSGGGNYISMYIQRKVKVKVKVKLSP
jgi:hypothetical protein